MLPCPIRRGISLKNKYVMAGLVSFDLVRTPMYDFMMIGEAYDKVGCPTSIRVHVSTSINMSNIRFLS